MQVTCIYFYDRMLSVVEVSEVGFIALATSERRRKRKKEKEIKKE
jgi:hypothetical protein